MRSDAIHGTSFNTNFIAASESCGVSAHDALHSLTKDRRMSVRPAPEALVSARLRAHALAINEIAPSGSRESERASCVANVSRCGVKGDRDRVPDEDCDGIPEVPQANK